MMDKKAASHVLTVLIKLFIVGLVIFLIVAIFPGPFNAIAKQVIGLTRHIPGQGDSQTFKETSPSFDVFNDVFDLMEKYKDSKDCFIESSIDFGKIEKKDSIEINNKEKTMNILHGERKTKTGESDVEISQRDLRYLPGQFCIFDIYLFYGCFVLINDLDLPSCKSLSGLMHAPDNVEISKEGINGHKEIAGYAYKSSEDRFCFIPIISDRDDACNPPKPKDEKDTRGFFNLDDDCISQLKMNIEEGSAETNKNIRMC